MNSTVTITTNKATMLVDFEKKKIVFNRNADHEYVIHLIPMEINFSDITDIELKNPKPLSMGQCNIIVKGIRYVTEDEKYDMTRFLAKDFDLLKTTLTRVLQECGLSNFKEYRSVNAPKVIYKNVLGEFETRKKCQSCGYIFCYSPLDLRENKMNQKLAFGYGMSATLGTGTAMGSLNQMNANNANNKIRDFDCCPQCNSRNLKVLTKEEYNTETTSKNTPEPTTPTTSAADELKKFKELLDMGIITQEEFDTKKKQLLGF